MIYCNRSTHSTSSSHRQLYMIWCYKLRFVFLIYSSSYFHHSRSRRGLPVMEGACYTHVNGTFDHPHTACYNPRNSTTCPMHRYVRLGRVARCTFLTLSPSSLFSFHSGRDTSNHLREVW